MGHHALFFACMGGYETDLEENEDGYDDVNNIEQAVGGGNYSRLPEKNCS